MKKKVVFVCVCVCVCEGGGCKMEEKNGRARCELENCKSRSLRWGEDMLLCKDEGMR